MQPEFERSYNGSAVHHVSHNAIETPFYFNPDKTMSLEN